MSTLGAQTETEIILSAHPSGSAIGGTCWKIEYNKQLIVYAVDMNDVPLTISVPMMRFSDFKNANILITNSYYKPKVQLPNNGLVSTGSSKSYKFLSDEKLKSKLEKVLVDLGGQILIPISDKNMIMQCLITLEQIFASNSKLQANFRDARISPVIYLEHMSRDTVGVGRSHLGWMNFTDSSKIQQDLDDNPLNF